jgi:hypothetical protein
MRFEDLKIGEKFRFSENFSDHSPICMKVRHVRGDKNVNFVYVDSCGSFLGVASFADLSIDVISLSPKDHLPDTVRFTAV